ncbi:MAG TPA: hypothetical protein VFN76_09885 [Candidatus Limnocylindria bacterium]|nr:hypothetical protein [Candidatus Limnocylindria bacterium]
MGVHPNIAAGRFPKQGEHLHARVRVCFHYDTSREFPGEIVRDDIEPPFETIIAIDDGPVVRSVECQYAIDSKATV